MGWMARTWRRRQALQSFASIEAWGRNRRHHQDARLGTSTEFFTFCFWFLCVFSLLGAVLAAAWEARGIVCIIIVGGLGVLIGHADERRLADTAHRGLRLPGNGSVTAAGKERNGKGRARPGAVTPTWYCEATNRDTTCFSCSPSLRCCSDTRTRRGYVRILSMRPL